MNKHFLSILAVLVALSLMFVGCTDQTEKPQNQPSNNELSLKEVLTKSEATMEKTKGLSYKIEGTQSLGTGSRSLATDLSLDVKVTYNPVASYIKGKVKVLGQETAMEMYMVDNTTYQQVAGKWTKLQSMMPSNLYGDGPSEMLKQLSLVLGNSKDANGSTMKKENGFYVITIDSAVVKDNQEFLNNILKSVQERNKALMSQGNNMDLSKLKIENFNQVYYFDEKNFALKKAKSQLKMSMPIQGQIYTVDQNLTTDITGSFEGKIEVPADVKQKAISLEDSLNF